MLGEKIKASPPEIKDVRFRRKNVAFILVNAILHVFVQSLQSFKDRIRRNQIAVPGTLTNKQRRLEVT